MASSPAGHLPHLLPDEPWKGDLVVYAHGYVPSGSALSLPGEAESFSALMRRMGYAFATTSYHENGLAVLSAIDDLLDLVRVFGEQHGAPGRVFLIGASGMGIGVVSLGSVLNMLTREKNLP